VSPRVVRRSHRYSLFSITASAFHTSVLPLAPKSLYSDFNAIARSFNLPLVFHLDMPLHKHGSHLSIPSLATIARRSLRHFPRGTTSHGLSHTTVLVIAISASVGGLLLILVLWFILSRRSARSRSVPLPQRQALVHQRERQLVAFTEHQNASLPKLLPDDRSRPPSVKYVGDSLRDTSHAASSSNYEVDERTAPPSFFEGPLHPPIPPFLTPRTPPNASSTSLPLPYGRSTSSLDGNLPPDTISPSPNQSLKRAANRSRSRRRPLSMGSFGTSQTTATVRSRSSTRAAPHAPHSNIQIVLPAPLAPNLYERLSSEEPRMRRPSMAESVYTDSCQASLVDTWVSIGQHDVPEPEPIERQSRDSMEQRSRRLMRSTCVALLIMLYA